MEGIRLYRCLRSERLIDGVNKHDECADIIARNPNIDFRPGLVGVEVDHMVYKDTNWDADSENYPRVYLEDFRGKLGHIIVSCDIYSGMPFDEYLEKRRKTPEFYQTDWMARKKDRNWYIAWNTIITRVRVEKVIEKRPFPVHV